MRQNIIERSVDMNIIRDVIMHERKIRLAEQMPDIIRRAGNEIIHADNFVAFGDKPVAKMTS